MADLLKKLNTLMRAGLHDFVGSERERAGVPVPPGRLGKNIDGEIAAMRERIRDAAAYEENMRQKIAALEAEITRLDETADDAVERGDDVIARSLIAELRRSEQRLVMLQGDLYQHQAAASELAERVEQLEAMVDAAKRSQANAAPAEETSGLPSLSDVLRRARETITGVGEQIQAADEIRSQPDTREQTSNPSTEERSSDEDDLEHRRQRLTKKD